MRPQAIAALSIRLMIAAMAGVAATIATAQTASLKDEAYVELIAVVSLVDHFKGKCAAAGATPKDIAAKTAQWEATNQADVIRRSMVELRKDPASARSIDQATSSTIAQIEGARLPPCPALGAVLDLPDAQLSKRHGALLAALAATDQPAPAGRATADRGPPPVPPPTTQTRPGSDPSIALAADIEGFAFDWNTQMGFGGGMTVNTFPVVLFRNGEALTDVEGLAAPGGAAAHKRANPEDWTKWRREGGKLQTLKDGKWDDLGYQVVYSKLPEGFRLNGRFQRTSGTGNIYLGGGDAVAVYSTYEFTPDGKVTRGGGASATSETSQSRTVATSIADNQRGTYSIQGVTLTLRYADGTSEAMILVTDPKEPKTIWLDGYGYVKRG
jgi:hypothetical protein